MLGNDNAGADPSCNGVKSLMMNEVKMNEVGLTYII